uniref:Putative secreted protein n=1 Tax=Ixodes ricinus TaxID=34613 RepID=A0A147BB69_IXORI
MSMRTFPLLLLPRMLQSQTLRAARENTKQCQRGTSGKHRRLRRCKTSYGCFKTKWILSTLFQRDFVEYGYHRRPGSHWQALPPSQ